MSDKPDCVMYAVYEGEEWKPWPATFAPPQDALPPKGNDARDMLWDVVTNKAVNCWAERTYGGIKFRAIKFPDGREWDAVNGWREEKPFAMHTIDSVEIGSWPPAAEKVIEEQKLRQQELNRRHRAALSELGQPTIDRMKKLLQDHAENQAEIKRHVKDALYKQSAIRAGQFAAHLTVKPTVAQKILAAAEGQSREKGKNTLMEDNAKIIKMYEQCAIAVGSALNHLGSLGPVKLNGIYGINLELTSMQVEALRYLAKRASHE